MELASSLGLAPGPEPRKRPPNASTRGLVPLAEARTGAGGGGGAAGRPAPRTRERAPQWRRAAGRQDCRGKFFGRKSLPRENHADLKYPLSGGRCAARANIVWPWGAILDFARWRAGTNGPSSGGLARMGSGANPAASHFDVPVCTCQWLSFNLDPRGILQIFL